MALLFPTALSFYLGAKMVFSAYQEYRRWWEAYQEERREEGREEGLEQGREEERARVKRELEERGVTLFPETAKILFGEPDADS